MRTTRKGSISLAHQYRSLYSVVVLLALLMLGVILIVAGIILPTKSNFWANVCSQIGFVFAPTAVLALLYQRFAEISHAKEVAGRVSDFLESRLAYRLEGRLADSDIVAVYPARHSIDFRRFYGRANSSIDILTTNLQSMELYLPLLASRAEQEVMIRILTLDPRNSFVEARYRDLRFEDPESFADEMIVSLNHFFLESMERRTFEIKIYSSPPSFMMFRSDARIIVGLILQQGRARNSFHIEFDCALNRANRRESDQISQHFELLWDRAEYLKERFDRISNALPSQGKE